MRETRVDIINSGKEKEFRLESMGKFKMRVDGKYRQTKNAGRRKKVDILKPIKQVFNTEKQGH